MAAIIEEVHKRYSIKGLILKYRLDGGVININDLVDSRCNEKHIFEILYVDDWLYLRRA